jgi:ribose transport system substrate-binding protein
MRNRKLLIGFVIAVVLLLVAETYIYINYSKLQKEPIKISFVLTGDNMDKWENLMAGAETAALDEACILDFTNSPVEYGLEGEIEIIERQFEDGADYVMVASSDYEAMKDYVKTSFFSDRIIFVKNGIYKDSKKSVLSDDYKLGVDFANYILEDNKVKKLIMVTTNEDVNCQEMRSGIEDTLKNSEIKVEYRLMSATSGTLNQSMYNLGQSGLYNGFITLDYPTMAAAAKAQSKLKSKVAVYSIDNSKEAVYYLDSNEINAVAFKDDYSIGFMAVKQIIDSKSLGDLETESLYYIVNKDSIHTAQMEKVLFPFVK